MPITIASYAISAVRFCLAMMTLCILGCTSNPATQSPEAEPTLDIHTIAVLPFEKGVGSDDSDDVDSSMRRCPLCGAIFQGGPIEDGADTYMTERVVKWMGENTSYTLIPPGMVEGVRSQMLSEEPGMPARRLIEEAGKRLEADAVLYGVIYRFQQRVGTSLSVDTPASVAFDIHLVRVADGQVIWVGHFDETQQSLSDNLFRLGAFVKRGGEWLTAEELASFGLNDVMSHFFTR
jgi:hypothetical protein